MYVWLVALVPTLLQASARARRSAMRWEYILVYTTVYISSSSLSFRSAFTLAELLLFFRPGQPGRLDFAPVLQHLLMDFEGCREMEMRRIWCGLYQLQTLPETLQNVNLS